MATEPHAMRPCASSERGRAQDQNTFTLPNHMDRKLSPDQSVELLADHFAAISQEYDPISISAFPPNIKQVLSNPNCAEVPRLEEYEVFRKICKAEKFRVMYLKEYLESLPVNLLPLQLLYTIPY